MLRLSLQSSAVYIKMANKAYQKGRRKEYKVCNELKEEGYDIAQRSAGSHSPIDVWAINKDKKEYSETKIESHVWNNDTDIQHLLLHVEGSSIYHI